MEFVSWLVIYFSVKIEYCLTNTFRISETDMI